MIQATRDENGAGESTEWLARSRSMNFLILSIRLLSARASLPAMNFCLLLPSDAYSTCLMLR